MTSWIRRVAVRCARWPNTQKKKRGQRQVRKVTSAFGCSLAVTRTELDNVVGKILRGKLWWPSYRPYASTAVVFWIELIDARFPNLTEGCVSVLVDRRTDRTQYYVESMEKQVALVFGPVQRRNHACVWFRVEKKKQLVRRWVVRVGNRTR